MELSGSKNLKPKFDYCAESLVVIGIKMCRERPTLGTWLCRNQVTFSSKIKAMAVNYEKSQNKNSKENNTRT